MAKKHLIGLPVILIFLLQYNSISAQNNFSFKLTTFSYQFTDAQPDVIKLKISQSGNLAFEPGLLLAYEEYASSNTALKISQSVILDKAAHLAGSTQVMIKFRVVKSFKHALYIGLGPVFHYRKTWADMENYVDEPVYNSNDDWQYKFWWLSGEIDYNYYLNKYTDLSISLNHVQAESIGLSVGIKRWINKNPKKKRGCVSCPGLH